MLILSDHTLSVLIYIEGGGELSEFVNFING